LAFTAEQMEAALRAAGHRLTPQRRAIIQYLAATETHPTARRIREEVGKTRPSLSLATVYNTLGTLLRLGLIKLLEFGEENRVETNLTPHINLVCTGCDRIIDFPEGKLYSPQDLLEKTGFQVLDFRLEYYGLCRDCREKGGRHG